MNEQTQGQGCIAPEWCGIHRTMPSADRKRDTAFLLSRGDYSRSDMHLFCSDTCRDRAIAPAPKAPMDALERYAQSIYTPPAPHPERRAVEVGNRYRYGSEAFTVTEPWVDDGKRIGWKGREDNGRPIAFFDSRWTDGTVTEIDSPSPASEPAKACNGRCMTNVGTMDRLVWTVCNACAEQIERNIAAAKASKVAAPDYCCARGLLSEGLAHSDDCTRPPPLEAKGPTCAIADRHTCDGPVLERILGKGFAQVRDLFCELAARNHETAYARKMNATGDSLPENTPERIRLAHVAGLHDDDLL